MDNDLQLFSYALMGDDFHYKLRTRREFHHYVDLPPEMRMVIVNEMRPTDKVRFTRCSRVSKIEATTSKNFNISQLHLHIDANHIEVKATFNEHKKLGFTVMFHKYRQRKYIESKNLKNKLIGVIKLDESVDFVQWSSECFKNLMKQHQKTIKKLGITGANRFIYGAYDHVDFEVPDLINLEELILYNFAHIRQILPKISHPLRVLNCYTEWYYRINLADFDQIYQVQDTFIAPYTRLNREQFMRLKATTFSIHIGELTHIDIINFMQTFIKTKIPKKFEYFEWNLDRSEFNVLGVFEHYGRVYNGRKKDAFDFFRDGKTLAEVIYNNPYRQHNLKDTLIFKASTILNTYKGRSPA